MKAKVLRVLTVLVLSIAIFGGCAINRDPGTLRSMTARQDDPYRQASIYRGAKAGVMQLWALLPYDRSMPAEYGLSVYVSHFNQGWRHYTSAADREGTPLRLQPLRVNVKCGRVGCFKDEPVVVLMTRAYLEAHRFTGLDLKLMGMGGSDVYQFPAGHVEAFLASLPPG